MLKRLFVIFFILILATNTVVIAEEAEFRFSNWPLSEFESRKIINPFSEAHFGVDIAASEGEEVQAVADGKVYWTYSGGSHGISVGIEHPNGWRTTYLHLSERLVKKGQEVKASDVIGKIGTTGSGRDAEEAHLHFALIIDPAADVNDYSRRYADPLAYGPVQQTPAEEPAEEPIVHPVEQIPEIPAEVPAEEPVVQPVEQMPAEEPALHGTANRQPVIEARPNQKPEMKRTEHLAGNTLESSRKTNTTAKEKIRQIKPVETQPLILSAEILEKALKKRLPKSRKKVSKLPNLDAGLEVSKWPDKSVILIYWLMLSVAGYFYYWINRKKRNKFGFTC